MAKVEPSEARRQELAKASIAGTHAFQVLLAQKDAKGDPKSWAAGALSTEDLEGLVKHQASLLADDTVEIDKWIRGEASAFDAEKDLKPLVAAPPALAERLPVSAFLRYLDGAVTAKTSDMLAVANLYQTCLESERDGTVLWDEMHFYRALGYKTYVGQLGLPGGDTDFLAVGKILEPLTCASPFGTTAADWQIVGRKVWNWGEKYGHIRDQYTMATEILGEPDIRVLIPRIRAVKAQKIACIGHSFSMQSHWSTPGSFWAVVKAMFQMENPGIEMREWQGGGLTPTRAFNNFYQSALEWKPDKVLFVLAVRNEEDYKRLAEMCAGLPRRGRAGVHLRQRPRPHRRAGDRPKRYKEISDATGLTVIDVVKLIDEAPESDKFLCLDRIHMTEPYHRLMAREWLKFLVGVRGAGLE